MLSWRRAAPLALLLAGCGAPRSRAIDLPPEAADASTALLVLRDRDTLTVRVWGANTPLRLELDRSRRVTLLLTDADLSDVTDPRGHLRTTEASGCPLLPLLEPLRAFEGELGSEGALTAWRSVDRADVDPGLEALSVDSARCPVSACTPFSVETARLEGFTGRPVWGIELGPDRLLVGIGGDEPLLTLGPDRRPTPLARPPGPPLTSAWTDAEGQLWMGSHDGALLRGWVETGGLRLEVAGTYPGARTLEALAGGTRERGFDVYALASTGELLRFRDGDRVDVLETFEPTPFGVSSRGGLVEVEPGRLAGVWGAEIGVFEVSEGDRVERFTPPGLTEAGTAIIDAPGLGPVFGTGSFGLLWGRTPAGWSELGVGITGVEILTMIAYEGGLVVGGTTGATRRLSAARELCPGAPVSAKSVRLLLPFGGGLAAFTDPVMEGGTPDVHYMLPAGG